MYVTLYPFTGKGRVGDFEEDHSDSLSVTSSVDGLSICDDSICKYFIQLLYFS